MVVVRWVVTSLLVLRGSGLSDSTNMYKGSHSGGEHEEGGLSRSYKMSNFLYADGNGSDKHVYTP